MDQSFESEVNEIIGLSEIAIAAKTTISRYARIKIAKS